MCRCVDGWYGMAPWKATVLCDASVCCDLGWNVVVHNSTVGPCRSCSSYSSYIDHSCGCGWIDVNSPGSESVVVRDGGGVEHATGLGHGYSMQAMWRSGGTVPG